MIDMLWREVLKCLVFCQQRLTVAFKACSSCHTTICQTHRFREFHGSSCLHCGFSWWLLDFWKFWRYNCAAVDGVGCQKQQGTDVFGWRYEAFKDAASKQKLPIRTSFFFIGLEISSQNFFLVWHLQATHQRHKDFIFDVLSSAKGGFKRFHQRLHRIAAGPVLREAAARGDPKAWGTPPEGVATYLW